MPIRNITVVGAGTMGHAIALVFALHGHPVNLYEAAPAVGESALSRIEGELRFLAADGFIPESAVAETLSRVTLYDTLPPAVQDADYVIEAIPEELPLKQALLAQLDAACPAHTILASNTSSLRLADMTAHLPPARRAKTMICHWYNPAHLIPLAELSQFGNMAQDDFERVWQLYQSAGKKPIRVLQDIPGLIANRLLHAMAREAFHLSEVGAASAEDIDAALKYGPGFRAATTGLLESADLGGLDIWCAAEDNFLPDLDASTRAGAALRNRVAEGRLGVKAGAGFFAYTQQQAAHTRASFSRRLLTQLRATRQMDDE